MYAYGVTQQGIYHVKKNLVCQDSHAIIKCSDNMAIAAVADGLGSEEHSDVASRIAADFSTAFCAEHLTEDSPEDEILNTIKTSFMLAQQKIEKTADENGHEYTEYDTTLSLAILIGTDLYYGHSGDSGIVALSSDGMFQSVTSQQRDADGRVFPLFFGEEKWVFGHFEKPVVSVFLATDGMYEILFPIYIRNEAVPIYVALARYFMDPNSLHAREFPEEGNQERIGKFMASIPEQQVNDDKTVVVVTNPDAELSYQPPEYYAEPNWNELRRKYEEAWKKSAYPHMYEAKNTVEEQPAQEHSQFMEQEEDVAEQQEDTKAENLEMDEMLEPVEPRQHRLSKAGESKETKKGFFEKILGKKETKEREEKWP